MALIEINNVRSHPRHIIKTLVRLQKAITGDSRISTALSLDMSIQGISLLSSSLLQVGEQVTLWLCDQNEQELIRLQAEVMWTEIDELYGDSPYWLRTGLKFHETDATTRSALSRYLPAAPVFNLSSKRRKHLLSILP